MTTETISVNLPASQLWELLNDPQHLVSSVDNVVGYQVLPDRSFNLTVNVDTGIGSALYTFRCNLHVTEPGRGIQVHAVGSNAHNIVEFTANVQLVDSDKATVMCCHIDTKARGGLASVAQRTVDGVIVRHVRDWLNNAVHAQVRMA